MLDKLREIVRADGVSGFARRSVAYAYRRGVRLCIPESQSVTLAFSFAWIGSGAIAGFPTSWLPEVIREGCADEPGYEAALIAGLTESIRPGDSLVVVGTGLGVTAVVAALRTGPSGTVHCFEASKKYVRLAQQTVARNKVTNISVHNAVVAKFNASFDWSVASDFGPLLTPSQLPPCKVLQMDCEGAEVDICAR